MYFKNRKYNIGTHGYYQCTYKSHGKWKIKLLHREVWESYYGPIPPGYNIHHKDMNPLNNDINNLELISSERHARDHGRSKVHQLYFVSPKGGEREDSQQLTFA